MLQILRVDYVQQLREMAGMMRRMCRIQCSLASGHVFIYIVLPLWKGT